jgi:two-component system, NtrC family, sensor kinase
MADVIPRQSHAEQKFSLLCQLSPLAVIEWSADFKVLAWNAAAEKTFGYSAAEIMAGDVLDLLVLPSDRAVVLDLVKELLEEGRGNCSTNQNLTKDGRIILCEWYNTPLIDESGTIVGIVSMAQDVTERERIETELKETKRELENSLKEQEVSYRSMLSLIPDLIMRMNRDGTFLEIVASGDIKTVGSPRPGVNFRDTLPEDLAKMREYYIARAFSTRKTQVYEQPIKIEGELHVEEVRIVLSESDEVIVIVRDISDRKKSEAQRKETEIQLKASQKLLQLVIDNIPQKIFWKDIDCVFMGCNQGFMNDIGVTAPDQVIGKTDFDLCHVQTEAESHRADDLQVMASGMSKLHITQSQILANGQTILIEGSKIPLHDDRGNVVGILGTYADVTERRRAEAELKETLQQMEYQWQLLRTVLDTSPDWIFAKDRQSRYLLANKSFSQAIGHPLKSILGRDDAELGCSEAMVYGDAELGLEGFHAIDQRVINGEVFYDSYSPITTADGDRIFETKKVPLRDVQGEVFGVLGISRDITDRHQAERQLQESQDFLTDILDGIPDPIFVKDEQHRWVLANRAFCEMLAAPREELIGKSDYDISPKEYADVFWAQDNLVFQSEAENINEEYHSDVHGRIRFISTKKSCFKNATGQKFIVGAIRDITDRKVAEEAILQSESQLRQQTQDLELTLQELQSAQAQLIQSEKMSSLGQLVAGVSHEINNPVSFIYGNLKHATLYTQDLLKLVELYCELYPEPLPAIQALSKAIELEYLVTDLPKLLNSMKIGAERIQEIVRSLRIFSRMDEAEMKAVNIHEGIDSTLMILQNRIKAQGDRPVITITKNYCNLPLIECYAGQLNQVFMNILGNGIDALEEAMEDPAWLQKNLAAHAPDPGDSQAIEEDPEPLLAIDICTELVDSTWVSIRIKDNGLGIPEPVRQKLFNPFFTTKPVGKGTGMGLSISYQIITEKHGGQLQCLSTLGGGAEFVILIPIQQPDLTTDQEPDGEGLELVERSGQQT